MAQPCVLFYTGNGIRSTEEMILSEALKTNTTLKKLVLYREHHKKGTGNSINNQSVHNLQEITLEAQK